MKNWFAELNAIDVSGHVEKKNGLSYLPWMWAWTELKKRYPLSRTKVYETDDGLLVFKDPIGAHVKTAVTIVWDEDGQIFEHTETENLPVMDYKNKAVKFEDIDSMAVNKTIQRSLTKCIARLGLGAYIYAGEDLPEESDEVKEAKAQEAQKLAEEVSDRIAKIDKEIKRVVTPMNKEEKANFAETIIKPIVGQINYKTCKDVKKLDMLFQKLQNTKAA